MPQLVDDSCLVSKFISGLDDDECRAGDQIKRFELYNKVENMIIEDAAWLPLWFAGERHILLKSYVKGYEITPMIVPKMRHVYIE